MMLMVMALALTGSCAAVPPAEESRLLETIRDACNKRDKAAILALVCWDHAAGKDRQAASEFVDDLLSRPVKSVNYLLLGSMKPPGYTRDGVLHAPNLVITHEVEIEYEDVPELPSREAESFYCGEKEGKLMIIILTPCL